MVRTITLDGMKRVSFYLWESDSGLVVEARASLMAGDEEIRSVARIIALSAEQRQQAQAVFNTLKALLQAREL